MYRDTSTDWDLEAERAAESGAPTLGATIRTTRAIGSMPAGTVGRIIRRNRRSVTISVAPNGVATVPLGTFDVVS